MIIAVVGAWYIGEYTEAAMVIFLFAVAEVLEGYAVERSRKSIRSLMDLTPKEVRIKEGNEEKLIPVDNLQEATGQHSNMADHRIAVAVQLK